MDVRVPRGRGGNVSRGGGVHGRRRVRGRSGDPHPAVRRLDHVRRVGEPGRPVLHGRLPQAAVQPADAGRVRGRVRRLAVHEFGRHVLDASRGLSGLPHLQLVQPGRGHRRDDAPTARLRPERFGPFQRGDPGHLQSRPSGPGGGARGEGAEGPLFRPRPLRDARRPRGRLPPERGRLREAGAGLVRLHHQPPAGGVPLRAGRHAGRRLDAGRGRHGDVHDEPGDGRGRRESRLLFRERAGRDGRVRLGARPHRLGAARERRHRRRGGRAHGARAAERGRHLLLGPRLGAALPGRADGRDGRRGRRPARRPRGGRRRGGRDAGADRSDRAGRALPPGEDGRGDLAAAADRVPPERAGRHPGARRHGRADEGGGCCRPTRSRRRC